MPEELLVRVPAEIVGDLPEDDQLLAQIAGGVVGQAGGNETLALLTRPLLVKTQSQPLCVALSIMSMSYIEKMFTVTSPMPLKFQLPFWWLWPASWKCPQLPSLCNWARLTDSGPEEP